MLDRSVPEFGHCPSHLPRLGLAVTLEPYWLLWNADQLPAIPGDLTIVPVSCGEVEGMVSAALAGPIDELLIRLANEPVVSSRQFNSAFSGVPRVGNPILDSAFEDLLGV